MMFSMYSESGSYLYIIIILIQKTPPIPEAQAGYQPEQIMPGAEEVPTSNLQLGQSPVASGMLKFSISYQLTGGKSNPIFSLI